MGNSTRILRLCRFAVAAGGIGFSAQRAQAAPIPFTIIDSDPNRPGVMFPAYAAVTVREPQGRLYATYGLSTNQSTHWYNYVRWSDDDGATWSAAVRTESQPDSSGVDSLAIDGQGRLFQGYHFNVGSFFAKSEDRGQTWQSATALLDGGWGAWDYSPVLAVDSTGTLHAVFYAAFGWGDPPFNIRYTSSSDQGATWTTAGAITQIPNNDAEHGNGALQPSIEIGRDDDRFVTYFTSKSEAESASYLLHFDGTAWRDPVQLSAAGATSSAAPALAVDSTGLVHLAYIQKTATDTKSHVIYRTYDPATRQLTAPKSISDPAADASRVTLGVFANNKTVVAYDSYDPGTKRYGGVWVSTSTDGFASSSKISTHPEAKLPSLRRSYNNFHLPERIDLVWVEPSDVSGGESIVYADLSGTSTAPPLFKPRVWGPKIVNPGQIATFLIEVKSTLPAAAEGTVLVAQLPWELPYDSSTAGGIYRTDAGRHEVVWKLGTVASAETRYVAVRLLVPWGLADGVGKVTARLASKSMTTKFPVDDYLNYNPVTVQSAMLDAPSVQKTAADNASVGSLLAYAQSKGYLSFDAADQSTLSSGSKLTRVFLVDPKDASPAILTWDGTTALIEHTNAQGRTVFNADGGYTVNQHEGTLTSFGTWAEQHSPSAARCQANCTLNKVPGWFLDAASKTIGMVGTGIACATCARSKGKDLGACANCANAYHEVPGVGYAVDVAECLKECLENPNLHVCTEAKSECGSSFLGWITERDTKLITECNTYTGTYAPVSKRVLCDPGDVCQNGVCGPKGCGTANRDLDDETCDITDFEVVPAHDPNAKAVSPSGNVVPGQTLSYTISYENEGQGTAFDVFVLDPVSEYLDDKTIALGNGGIYSDASRLASWDVGTLAAGQQGSVTMDVAVQAGLATGTQIINMAEVHFPSAGEVTPTNPVVSVVAAVAAHPQRLDVESGASLDIVLTGQEASGAPVTFSLTGKPLYGTLTGTAPNLTYAAEAGFAGTDSFSFVATSQGVDSDPARVAITVLPSSTDKTGAEIIGTFPEPDATDVGIGMDRSTSDSYLPIVSAQFSEAMDPATLDGTAFQIEGATGQVFFDAALRTVYFYPTEPLQPGTAYLATVNATAADSAGNPLAKPYSWTFTTVAAKSLRASLPPGEDGLGFGNVDVGTRSSPRFVSLESKGIESVTVSKIRIEGGNGQFSIAEQNCTAALDPDQSCFASVVFTPNAAGASTAQLVIDSDDPKQPSIVMLAGTGLIGDADAKDKSVGCSCRVGTSRRANHGAVVAGVLACAAVVFRRRRTRTTSNLRSSLLRSA